jgi:glucan phosphoethanolaminetransferase (alkaline phosphatase superfamily)
LAELRARDTRAPSPKSTPLGALDMWENFKSFFEQPYKGAAEMDVIDWFFFMGLLIVLLVIWNLVFYHIKEGITS